MEVNKALTRDREDAKIVSCQQQTLQEQVRRLHPFVIKSTNICHVKRTNFSDIFLTVVEFILTESD